MSFWQTNIVTWDQRPICQIFWHKQSFTIILSNSVYFILSLSVYSASNKQYISPNWAKSPQKYRAGYESSDFIFYVTWRWYITLIYDFKIYANSFYLHCSLIYTSPSHYHWWAQDLRQSNCIWQPIRRLQNLLKFNQSSVVIINNFVHFSVLIYLPSVLLCFAQNPYRHTSIGYRLHRGGAGVRTLQEGIELEGQSSWWRGGPISKLQMSYSPSWFLPCDFDVGNCSQAAAPACLLLLPTTAIKVFPVLVLQMNISGPQLFYGWIQLSLWWSKYITSFSNNPYLFIPIPVCAKTARV